MYAHCTYSTCTYMYVNCVHVHAHYTLCTCMPLYTMYMYMHTIHCVHVCHCTLCICMYVHCTLCTCTCPLYTVYMYMYIHCKLCTCSIMYMYYAYDPLFPQLPSLPPSLPLTYSLFLTLKHLICNRENIIPSNSFRKPSRYVSTLFDPLFCILYSSIEIIIQLIIT